MLALAETHFTFWISAREDAVSPRMARRPPHDSPAMCYPPPGPGPCWLGTDEGARSHTAGIFYVQSLRQRSVF